MINAGGFAHLDPSSTKTYDAKVVYGFELPDICLLLKVSKGYLVETPRQIDLQWCRGQHIDTLSEFFVSITPVHWLG